MKLISGIYKSEPSVTNCFSHNNLQKSIFLPHFMIIHLKKKRNPASLGHIDHTIILLKVLFESLMLKQRLCYRLEEVPISYRGGTSASRLSSAHQCAFLSPSVCRSFPAYFVRAVLSQPHLRVAVPPFSASANMLLWLVLARLCAPALFIPAAKPLSSCSSPPYDLPARHSQIIQLNC